MARIVELVLILNGLGGIATYLGFKVRRTRQAAKRGVNKVAGLAGVEVYHEDEEQAKREHLPHFQPYDPNCRACQEDRKEETPEKRSALAKFGDAIR